MSDLWIFVGALAVAYLVPGPDMILLLETGARHGRRNRAPRRPVGEGIVAQILLIEDEKGRYIRIDPLHRIEHFGNFMPVEIRELQQFLDLYNEDGEQDLPCEKFKRYFENYYANLSGSSRQKDVARSANSSASRAGRTPRAAAFAYCLRVIDDRKIP